MTNGMTIMEITEATGYSINWVRRAARKAAKKMPSIAKKNEIARGGSRKPARFSKIEVRAIKAQFTRNPNPRKIINSIDKIEK